MSEAKKREDEDRQMAGHYEKENPLFREYPLAKYYEPKPYWGCPNCGGNTWGAINTWGNPSDYVYRCYGPTAMGNPYVILGGCGTLFKLPPEAHGMGLDSGSEV